MKVRWRQQEILSVTVVVFFLFISFFINEIAISKNEMSARLNAGIYDNVMPRYFYTQIFPRLIPGVALYLFYLFLNLYLIPVLILKKRFFVLAILTGIFIWLALLGIYATAYYQGTIYTMLNDSGISLRRISFHYGFSVAGIIMAGYGIYAYIREMLIKNISRDNGNRPFRIMVINQVTGTAFTYLTVFVLMFAYGILRNNDMAIFYVFFLLPSIVTCFINIYWLFPLQQKNKISLKNILPKLIIAPALLAVICWVFFAMSKSGSGIAFFFVTFAILVFIATPVSWILYSFQREKLSEMLNLQKNLGKTAADLQFLRSQINPHFLFNALNTIYGTALQENADRTAEAVQKLGDMMRFMLEENQQDKIPLGKELTYLTNYIELQKLRTQISADIDISFTAKTDQCHYEIAPMLLIPFIENAFKHGISLREKSWIKINISCDTEQLYFDVYNSVHPKPETDPEKNRSGIGLENVKQRLSLLYPQQHELQIRSTATEYFVHLTIKP